VTSKTVENNIGKQLSDSGTELYTRRTANWISKYTN